MTDDDPQQFLSLQAPQKQVEEGLESFWKPLEDLEASCGSKADLVETKCRTEDPCRDKSVTSDREPGRFEAMVIETEKNAASGSTVIDENKGRDDLRQNPKKRGTSKDVVASLDQRVAGVETSMAELKNQVEGLEGLDSDFTSIREDFRVALNTLSGDLKREIHDLRDSFMGEITKIREEFEEEVSTLHQVIEALQADMALCKQSLASDGGNTNHGPKIDVPKPSPFVGKQEARAVDDFLWEMEQYLEGVNVRRRYGDIERGTATIDTWVEFVADFKNQFYPENAKNEAKSRLYKLKQSGTIQEYVKEFTTLVLEIPELSDQNYLFYFLDGLKGWAKTELERRGVQDLSTAIAHAKALIDFSTRRESSKPKDRKVNQEKGGEKRMPNQSLNGMSAHEDEEASDGRSMGSIRILNAIKAKKEVPKAVNSPAKAIHGVAKDVQGKIGEWEGTIDFSVVPMDDFKVVLGLEFLDKVRAFLMSFANSLCILDGGKTCMVSTERDAKSGAKTLSAMQFKKGFNKSEPCYLAVTRLETGEGSSKVEVPKVIERVLDEVKDVMPKELPKILPPRREVTIKNKYPIPLIADLFDQLGKARYFTKLALRSGYYQVRIADGDEAKTMCVTRYGSYEFLVMPFGLTNSYLEGAFLAFETGVPVLRDNELFVKLEKCSFAQDEVKFLGHKIKDGGLMMDGAKIKAIQDWEPPTKRLPDVTMPFELHTDPPDFAIGGFLMQDRHPIAFESSKLNEMERKYTMQEKEMTAVVHCLRIWRHYLLGSRFVIKTDNIATSYFQTQKKLSPKQARWQDFLAEFDYQLEYKPGKANVVADALSRKAEFAAITQAQFFLQDRIKEGLEHDPLAKKIIALAKDGRTQRFWLKGDMLFTKGDRLYVPKWGDLRRAILK
ncbi:ATP-binding cassette subfamily C member 8 [Tanacetum coccineum]|uniref:RNA-directed DNA polymerase n=1 Tax=Tanacetum coccineum TaxID=301880 RepID=A0ABQ5EJA0_9ASTR